MLDGRSRSDDQLRVAFCAPEFAPLQRAMKGESSDAAYLLLTHVANRLADRGHRLTYIAQRDVAEEVCTFDIANPVPAPLTWSDSEWFRAASRNVWRLQRAVGVPYLNVVSNCRLYDACLQILPGHDVVYERNGLYRDGIGKACRTLKLPYVLFVDADEIFEHEYVGRPLSPILRWRAGFAFRSNLNRADVVICVSEDAKRHLVRTWGVPDERIVVFSNGVDVCRFCPAPSQRVHTRASLGVNDCTVVLFVGSFYPWHDVSSLLEAFGHVRRTHPEARLLLVGDGAMRPSMERRAADLGLRGAVTFVGPVPHIEVPSLVEAADIAVVAYPSMKQSLWLSPLKLFEYMASGKAIVASSVGQLRQVIRDGCNGLLVPPGDVSALTEAILRLITDDALRLRIGEQARRDAVERHSWDNYVTRLESVLRAAIARDRANLS
jgi:glycosyltransferase involved in cell wall biosynthesis